MITAPRLREYNINRVGGPSYGPVWPIPAHFDVNEAFDLWSVDCQRLGELAREWAPMQKRKITPAYDDTFRVGLLVVDMQYTFCHPSMPLFCSGDSGMGAVEDVVRLARYIYQNVGYINGINCTLDSHPRYAIHQQDFWIGRDGKHPSPYTVITYDDVEAGVWMPNPAVAWSNGIGMDELRLLEEHALQYLDALDSNGRYPLIIWPQHARIGNVENAMMPILYEATEWHSACRGSETRYDIKGVDPLFEMYSAISSEVGDGVFSAPETNEELFSRIMEYDMVIAAGEAAGHCFAWTLRDILDMSCGDLAERMFILRDATSSVVIRDPVTGEIIPGTDDNPTDFRPMADAAFEEFENMGVRFTTTMTPICDLPGYGG